MEQEILTHLNDPVSLEKLYRSNKSLFTESFLKLSPKIEQNSATEFWNARLNYESNAIYWGQKNEMLYIAIACLVAGLVAKLPDIISVSPDFFYPRNLGFIIFPVLTTYFAWRNQLSRQTVGVLAGIFSICIIYINLLPNNPESDTLILACIHLPLLLWYMLGISFVGNKSKSLQPRLEFLKFNGEVAVLCAVLGIAGALLMGMTFGLFELIGINLEPFFEKYLMVFGLPAIPILGTFLTQSNPQLVNKVTPIIAKLFSPAVLIMLLAYVIAIIYSGKDPYNDREFLLIFNLLLIGVMALIFFSIAETSHIEKITFDSWVLFLLSCLTIVVNGIALSAITFRISEWGFTPNRLTVLVANLLILIHLLLVAYQLSKALRQKAVLEDIGTTVAKFIPIYFIWACIVVFVFPLVFGFM
ncbi:DUF4153 domain-containing protein [Algoriphagus lutimaris]|uniref:DUF4153 domain-containing protein n=1 Tax=Algoriphagus lutimaris TaxID=613197 RepID=UPI00196B47B4|nr:DUF4153 domain-containing protein [Algoriphagus lutimaris]MBN3518429.1 DUF4153 domain-containing protein [Algoriphagus lutimaris]